ncbi:CTB family bacteriocin [Acaryochloris sp. IP29b_bin.148]|uniref:CTB family bacteriocin n=1 Tax=Acaryochloris sp. IP29b_bin.148 TaxID=2969218 RepID=UPI00262A4C02|nr:CTB family bacteriocin [Acaryochloris sp. IP29b_bin.148]
MSELFTELSDQQQEIVAGGFSLKNYSGTKFYQNYKAAGATGGSYSGPGGSAAGGSVYGVHNKVNTWGGNYLNVKMSH